MTALLPDMYKVQRLRLQGKAVKNHVMGMQMYLWFTIIFITLTYNTLLNSLSKGVDKKGERNRIVCDINMKCTTQHLTLRVQQPVIVTE